jgi:large subunit ribosomal protein L15
MQLHELKRKTKNIVKRRVGRGGKRGKTSGRGTKGQKARAGHNIRPEIQTRIKKLPKLRGRGISQFKSITPKPVVINLDLLEKTFTAGAVVTPIILIEKGLVKKQKARIPKIKILGTGDLTKKLAISGCLFSASVKQKIETAGGTIA